MSDFDFPRASMLLHIVKAVADHGGALSSIGQLANLELADINADASEAINEHNAALAEEAQAAAAERAAEERKNRPQLATIEDEEAVEEDEIDEDEVEEPIPAKPTIPRRT